MTFTALSDQLPASDLSDRSGLGSSTPGGFGSEPIHLEQMNIAIVVNS